MAGAIVRLLAERDLRQLFVSNAAQSSDAAEELRKKLQVEFDGDREPLNPLEAERDPDATAQLLALAG